MSKKIKVNVSLSTEIHEKGKAKADEMGIPFSTYLSILISTDITKKARK